MANESVEKEFEEVINRTALVVFAIATIVVTIVLSLAFPWFGSRLKSDFWPIDRSFISPNITATVVQVIFYTFLAALIFDPVRRLLNKIVTRHKVDILDQIRNHHTVIAEKHEKQQNELLNHMKHIIEHHPDIPAYEPDNEQWS